MPEVKKFPDNVEEAYEVFRTEASAMREVLENTWMRNILYYMLEQWLSFLPESNVFARRYTALSGVPTPVSDIVRDYVRAMSALYLNRKFGYRVWPNTGERADKDAALLGSKVLQHMDSTDDYEIDDIKEEIVMWTVLSGNGFARTMFNIDDGRYVINKGRDPFSKGDVTVEVVSPFGVHMPNVGTRLPQKPYVGIQTIVDREWAEDTYKMQFPSSDIQGHRLDYQRQLLTLVSTVSPWKGRGMSNIDTSVDLSPEKVAVIEEIEFRPCKKYPEGAHATRVNGKNARFAKNLPIPISDDGRWCYSLTHFPYNRTPGGFWCSGGVDALISPQNTINEVDQALSMNRQSLGRPMLLTPTELTLKRLSERGSHLLAVEYDATTSSGLRPEFHRGTPYPQQILDERAIHRGVAQDAAGDPKNILRGQAPYSGASGIMVDILRETAEQTHVPDVNKFYRSWGAVSRKRLILAAKYFTESRIIKIQGKGNEILVQKFRGADLRNNTDVRLELESGASMTQSGVTNTIMELVKYGFFGQELGTSPHLQSKLLERMGLSGVTESGSDLHVQRAERENSILSAGAKAGKLLARIAFPGPAPELDPSTGEPVVDESGQPVIIQEFPVTKDPVFEYDNHAVHLETHGAVIFSAEFQTYPPETQKLYLGHFAMHQGAHSAQQQQAQQQQLEAAAMANALSRAAQGGMGGEQSNQGGVQKGRPQGT